MGSLGEQGGGGSQPSAGVGPTAACDGSPTPVPGPGLLPLLRTAPGLCRAAAPALVGDCGKMPLFWQLSGPGGAGSWDGMEEDLLPRLHLRSVCLSPSPGQVTTLVSSAFLIVKVILSEVSGSGSGWCGGHLACRMGSSQEGTASLTGFLSLLSGLGEGDSCPWLFLRGHLYWLCPLALLKP